MCNKVIANGGGSWRLEFVAVKHCQSVRKSTGESKKEADGYFQVSRSQV